VEPGNFSDPAGSKLTEGDFEPLFRRHGARIYALSVRLCGNATDGDDLAQETFITAYRRIGQFRGEADFGSWVYRICVNLWKNRVRYEKRRSFWKHISIFGDDKGRRRSPSHGNRRPQRQNRRPRRNRRTQRLVQSPWRNWIPTNGRPWFLREMEDKSYEEIADLLDLPLGTVKSRIARARATLKERLAPLLRDL
jgi:RNA polymerase sigma-70 factor (ECF subfamily)